MSGQHTITSDEREYPLAVFPDIMKYAMGELGLKVKIEFETPYGWREALCGEPLWQEGMRWRISFFQVDNSYIPTGIFPVRVVW